MVQKWTILKVRYSCTVYDDTESYTNKHSIHTQQCIHQKAYHLEPVGRGPVISPFRKLKNMRSISY